MAARIRTHGDNGECEGVSGVKMLECPRRQRDLLKSDGFVFHQRSEVIAPWRWMVNYHRANGSRFVITSGHMIVFILFFLSFLFFFSFYVTENHNGATVIGKLPPPEVKDLLRSHSFKPRLKIRCVQNALLYIYIRRKQADCF